MQAASLPSGRLLQLYRKVEFGLSGSFLELMLSGNLSKSWIQREFRSCGRLPELKIHQDQACLPWKGSHLRPDASSFTSLWSLAPAVQESRVWAVWELPGIDAFPGISQNHGFRESLGRVGDSQN